MHHLLQTGFKTFARSATALMLCAGLSIANATPATIEGQSFDGTAQVANTELQLNGVGVRAVAWIKGYAAGLYLPVKTRDAKAAVAAAGPKRVQMKMLLDDVSTEEFVKAFHSGIRKNHSEAEQAALAERMAQFDGYVRAIGKVRRGDTVDLDYIPGRGLVLNFNGKPRGQPIAGEDLYAALLKIFVGDRPVDGKLKAGLLGSAAT